MKFRGGRSLIVGLLSAVLCSSPNGSWAMDDPGQITKYFGPVEHVESVAGGSDGAVWFTTSSTIGYVVPGGTPQWFRTDFHPSVIALGPDGDMWVTGHRDSRARVAIVGADENLTEFSVPDGSRGITDMTLGDDGNMWTASSPDGLYQPGAITRVTPDGDVTAFPTGDGQYFGDGSPRSLTAGPDGRVWFIREGHSTRIVAMTTQGVREEYPLPAGYLNAGGLVGGSDGNLWFVAWGLDSEHYGAVVRMQPDGNTRLHPFPAAEASTIVWDSAVGPDGAVWITTTHPNRFTRVEPDGSMAQYSLPDATSGPYPLTAGPDGGMWFTGHELTPTYSGPYVGRVATGIEAQDYAPLLTGSGRVGSLLTCTTKPWPSAWATQMEWVRDGWVMPWSDSGYTPTTADEDHEFYCLDSARREGMLSPLMAFSDAVVVEDPPSVSAISPRAGPLQGGTLVTVRGAGFRPTAQVLIGSRECFDVVDVSATELTCLTPSGEVAGSVDVTVINPSGLSASLPGGFTYQLAPTATPTSTPTVTSAGEATWRSISKRVRTRGVLRMKIEVTAAGTVTVRLSGPATARKTVTLPVGISKVTWRLPKKIDPGRYKASLLLNGSVLTQSGSG